MKTGNFEKTNQSNSSSNSSSASAAAAGATAPAKNESYGIVLEINAATLPSETRFALMQVYDLPTVFTRADFLARVGTLARSFAQGVIEPLTRFDVRNYDYVAVVDKYPSVRRDRVLVETSREDWDQIRGAVETQAKASKENRKLARAVEKSKVFVN